MEIEKIVKQTLDTFGEEGNPSFYIRQGIKRGQLILERFNNKEIDLLIKIIMDSKQYTKEKQTLLDKLVNMKIENDTRK